MGIRVRFLEAFDCHMRVDLRGRKTRMSEQRLDASQVRSAIQHVGGETVPQLMRAD